MSARFTQAEMKALNLVWDEGEQAYVKINHPLKSTSTTPVIDVLPIASHVAEQPVASNRRSISLTLFGIPMPKQSVKQGINKKTGRKIFYQPGNKIDRKKDYIEQIKKQLPENFIPFSKEVFVTKFHCIYPPLKAFHSQKGKLDRIRNGEIFYKNTQPDLIDNLKKLIFDCMGKDKDTGIPLVLDNDGIIVGEDDTRKYYGMGGAIIIKMEGY